MQEMEITSIPDFVIKKARMEDTALILQFIHKLADYERLSHEVVATDNDIREHLFGEKPVAEVIIGYYQDQPVGFALFFHNFSTFLGKPGIYLEDLFVLEEHRGRGYGKKLLTYLARLAVERDCGRLEWAVLDWNEPAIQFYKSLGSRIMNEWLINRLTGNSLRDIASLF